MSEPGVGQKRPVLPPPHYLADQLTLLQQRRADYPLLAHNVFHLPALLTLVQSLPEPIPVSGPEHALQGASDVKIREIRLK